MYDLFVDIRGNSMGASLATNVEWAIEANRLVKLFGNNRAVDGVDLNVRAGSIYGV